MTPGESADTNPTIAQDKYASLPTGELVLFAVQHLHADGVPATVEEIVSACFKLFPHRFSLKNYFYWPDSALVVQALTDAKEKKLIKESPADVFILRPAGRKVARQSAKAMGVRFPMPPKVEKPTVDNGPQTVKARKSKSAPAKKKKQVKKVEKKANPKQKPERTKKSGVRELSATKWYAPATSAASRLTPKKKKKTPVKKATVLAKKKTFAKLKTQPKPKAQPKKPVAKPAPKKKAPVRKAVKKSRAATQLPLPVPVVPKKEAQKPVVKKKKIQPKVKQEAKPAVEKTPVVSKEEKVKAGRVLKMVERSDAYRQYKKLGTKVRISEFDFRNMLFATMESSAETLRRNVDLFKRYAGIHNRADLISFLDFAEGSFAPLLKTQAKTPARKK